MFMPSPEIKISMLKHRASKFSFSIPSCANESKARALFSTSLKNRLGTSPEQVLMNSGDLNTGCVQYSNHYEFVKWFGFWMPFEFWTCILMANQNGIHLVFKWNHKLYHINMCPYRDSNLGLSMTHRLKYEAAAITTRPPQPDDI